MPILRRALPGDREPLNRLAAASEAHWGFDDTFMERFQKEYCITGDFLALCHLIYRPEMARKVAVGKSQSIGGLHGTYIE